MEGEDGHFLSDILLVCEVRHVPGLDDIVIPVTQDTQIGHEEVQASRSTKGGRSKNFHWKEDEVVCSAWLNVSKDPINRANQSKSTFWGRVHAYYEEHNESGLVRTESSVMHRWLTIQTVVNKFCSAYEAIARRNQSGATIQDKMNESKKMYTELDKDKKIFTLDHCWAILKGEDKWKAKMVELAELEKLASKKTKKSGSKVSRQREEATSTNNQVIPAHGEEAEPKKRPDGIKKAKENQRRGGGEACMEALDKTLAKEAMDKEKEKAKEERFMATLEIEKAGLELEKKWVENEAKKAEAELMKEEKEIMLADTTSMNPMKRAWIESMQKKIRARLAEN